MILSMAHKPQVGDVHESPALPLITSLLGKGATVLLHDPLVERVELPDGTKLETVPLAEALTSDLDCTVIVTPHAKIDYGQVVKSSALVFDTRNAIRSVAPHVHRL